MSAAEPRLSREELARRGEDTFTRQVRPVLRPEDDGRFVAIAPESGTFEVDADDHAAVARLHRRVPSSSVRPGFDGEGRSLVGPTPTGRARRRSEDEHARPRLRPGHTKAPVPTAPVGPAWRAKSVLIFR